MGIQSRLDNCISEYIDARLLPGDARLVIDSEPRSLGIHHFTLRVESNDDQFEPTEDLYNTLSTILRENVIFDIVDEQSEGESEKSNKVNWINIVINLIAIGAIICLSLLFPPSIPLTIGLTAISFLTTAFTAREYLINFFRNLHNRNLANMTTTISLGWFLSLAHTLFHVISMPLVSSFSMVFMSFVMPVMLISFINGMEEIKRLVLNRAKKMQLQGIKSIFPQMSEEYLCYELTQEEGDYLLKLFQPINENAKSAASLLDSEKISFIDNLLASNNLNEEKKGLLRAGIILEVKRGECFPVDCILVDGNTVIDASILTGEPQQSKLRWERIPAGALNLGQSVKVYAENGAYTSTVNNLLFQANRARETAPAPTQKSTSKFTYLYTSLIILGLIAAIITPAALGILTLPLVMENLMGILFSVCPCTIAIAHLLPSLIGIYHRAKRGIQLRDESIAERTDGIHTIVFDKTGTLTTGNSSVESSDIPPSLWQRIYLLEKAQGGDHPIAKAIMSHYEANVRSNILLNEVKHCTIDSKNRGLSATVQGNRIQIGNATYLQEAGIALPEVNMDKILQGFSPVYVAENGVCQGVIYIQHEPRQDIQGALLGLKNQGIRIIMLTGDNEIAARAFNKQLGNVFDEVYAEQTPRNKEDFLSALMSSPLIDPKGLWFVGDGLNDAPSCRKVSEMGGISCAMTEDDKAAFFADISLNGSLSYLSRHNELNRFVQKNILQNQWIMGLSSFAFLAFIISFSIAGIAVSPFIPLTIMLATTMLVLFNSYRVQLEIDDTLDKRTSWPRKLLASNLSISFLVLGATLLIGATLIATIASGGLALPVIVFTAGVITALSSAFTLAATILLSTFALVLASHLLTNYFFSSEGQEESAQIPSQQMPVEEAITLDVAEEKHHEFNLFSKIFNTQDTPTYTNVDRESEYSY